MPVRHTARKENLPCSDFVLILLVVAFHFLVCIQTGPKRFHPAGFSSAHCSSQADGVPARWARSDADVVTDGESKGIPGEAG